MKIRKTPGAGSFSIKKLYSTLRNHGFQSVLLYYFRTLLVLVIVFAVGLAILFSGIMYYSTRQENLRVMEIGIRSAANSYGNLVAGVERDSFILSSLESLSGYTSAVSAKTIQNTVLTNMRRSLDITTWGNPTYDSIYVVSDAGNSVYYGKIYDREEFFDAELLSALDSTEDMQTVFSGHSQRSNRPVFCYARRVLRPVDNTPVGWIVFNLNMDADFLPDGNPQMTYDEFYVVSAEGDILLSGVPQSGEIPAELAGMFEKCAAGEFSYTMSGSGARAVYRFGEHGEAFAASVSFHDAGRAAASFFTGLMWSCIIFLVFTMLVSLLISLKLYYNIFNLISLFDVVSLPEKQKAKSGSSEFAYIRESIVGMTDKNRALESEFASKLADLRRAQAIALQTQINPHFLMNTLQMISSGFDGEDKASPYPRMLLLLSEIMRQILHTQDYLVTLEAEVLLAEKYLQLEQLRNNRLFDIIWDIAPETEKLMAVRFTLQPILENCILHGFQGGPDGGSERPVIRISSRLEQRELVITVADNGSGMDMKTLAELRKKLASDSLPEDSGIGLCNVALRLRIIFGKRGTLTVDSVPGDGSTVRITTPALSGDTLT